MDLETKRSELERLRAEVRRLEAEIDREEAGAGWQPSGDGGRFYGMYYAAAGFLLGIFGAMVSLMVNIIGAPMAGKSPLELIRIYLTFPLGAQALELTGTGPGVYAVSDGLILAIGCCLYLGTGMLLGIPVTLALARYIPRGGLAARLIVAGVVSLLIWGVNFYGILSWLQPMLIGGDPGNWITNPKYLPWWVGAATHVIFGWTIAVLYPLAVFTPYRKPQAPALSNAT